MAYIKALLLLLLTLIICPGHAQEVANPAAPINIPRAELICNPKDDEATYAMGNGMLFCVHFRVLGKKVAFKTDVDEFSSFELKGILNSIYTASGTAATENIVLQVGQHLSPKYEFLRDPNLFTPMLSVVIMMEEGKIKEFVWDNGCYDCSDSMCEGREITKYSEKDGEEGQPPVQDVSVSKQDNCVEGCANDENAPECKVKLYVTFMGTDSDGRHLRSAAKRPSQFERYSVADAFSS